MFTFTIQIEIEISLIRMLCIDRCHQHKAIKPRIGSRYALGQKYCSHCGVYEMGWHKVSMLPAAAEIQIQGCKVQA